MTMNIAMLGTGRIADGQLAPALAEVDGARLWSVLSRDAERGRAFAARHGAVAANAVHTDLGSLLADDDLDAVLIATPDKLHVSQCVAAARSGKHVLVEKPMATDIADAETMVESCHEAGARGSSRRRRWPARAARCRRRPRRRRRRRSRRECPCSASNTTTVRKYGARLWTRSACVSCRP